MDDSTVKAWQIILETKLSDYLASKYPGEMQTYMRFRKSNGPHCPLCKSAAKIMFKSEAVSKPGFLDRFKRNDWEGYIS